MASFNWPVNPTSFNAGPIQFEVDGVPTVVGIDTDTPADSSPLPVQVLDEGIPVDFATEAKQDDIITELEELNTKDFATEQTQLDVRAAVETIAAFDYATETTLAALEGKVLTDTQLRAAPLDVTGPLTDAELRATAVPVSGPLTDAQLRASAVPVSAAALPLPSGAATETTLSAINTKTPSLVTGRVPVDGSGVTQPISAASLPLPTGAATQTTLAAQAADIALIRAKVAASLVVTAHDYIGVTYVPSGNGAGEIQTVVYKTGGSGGTTVATLTLAYDSSNRLSSVTRS